MIRYKGMRRDGSAVTGSLERGGLASFTRDRYAWGWRWLEATLDGQVIASIERIDGARRWWANVEDVEASE